MSDSEEEIEYPSDSEDEDQEAEEPPPNVSNISQPSSLSSTCNHREMGNFNDSPYKVMNISEVLVYRQSLINNIVEFGFHESQSISLLSKHNWLVEDAMGEGLSMLENDCDGASKRRKGGTNDKQETNPSHCMICYDDITSSNELSCGHGCCDECWEGYLNTGMLNKADQIVNQVCPFIEGKMKCSQRIPESFFQKYLQPNMYSLYQERLFSDFVNHSSSISFCPKPTCQHVLFTDIKVAQDINDVCCDCGEFFCLNCSTVAHFPVSCDKAALWLKKEVSDGENELYMSSHTKPCPKCAIPIALHVCSEKCPAKCKEKNDDDDEDVRKAKDSEKERLKLAKERKRYEFHYSRYKQNQIGVKANHELVTLVERSVHPLVFTLDVFLGQGGQKYVDFLLEAAACLKDARHVLMWSYAYAYFLPQKHSNRQILEQQQGALEKHTNHVHSELVRFCEKGCAAEVAKFNAGDTTILRDWPMKKELTNYYLTLVQFLSNIKIQINEWEESILLKTELKRELSSGSADGEDVAGWLCLSCTFYNTHVAHVVKCEMCATDRPF